MKKYYNFEDGSKMPVIGLGTFTMKTEEDKKMFNHAILDLGYRHLDTAAFYDNQKQLGESLKQILSTKKVKRSDLFITTKLWNNQKINIEQNLKKSLQELQLDYIDCLLIHWPFSQTGLGKNAKPQKTPLHIIWKEMESCVKKGLTKSIGVSNFNCQILIDLLTYAEIKPICNQIELHPYLNQKRLVNWLNSNNIAPVAYCPIGRPWMVKTENNILENKIILELAGKYKKSVGQIVLNWGLWRGHVVIPKSSNAGRLRENIEAGDYVMEEGDYERVMKVNRDFRILDSMDNTFLDLKYPLFE